MQSSIYLGLSASTLSWAITRTWFIYLILAGSVSLDASNPSQIDDLQTNTPKIVFLNPVIELGRIPAGSTKKCEFVFSNAGTAELEIKDVRVSCGCTTAGDWTQKTAPGATGRIPVEFHATLYPGNFAKTVTVFTTDPTQPTTILQLRGEVWKPVHVEPQVAAIYTTPDALSSISTVVNITNNESNPVHVHSVTAESSAFLWELTTNAPGWHYQIKITPNPRLGIGTHQGKINLATTSTNSPTISIPVVIIVRPVLTVSPATIILPSEKLNTPLNFTITLHNNGATNVEIIEVEPNVQGITTEVKILDPGRTFRINLQFPEGFELPLNSQASLRIRTTSSQSPELFVPIVTIPHKTQPPVIPK